MHLIRSTKWSLVALAVALSGCGSDSKDSGGSGNADTFVGTWNYTSGTTTAVCAGETSTDTITGTVTFAKGSTSALVGTSSDNAQCPLKFDISGTTASAVGGQSCTVNEQGVTGMQNWSSLLFSSADGKTAHMSGSFTVVVNASGVSITCTGSVTADLQKL